MKLVERENMRSYHLLEKGDHVRLPLGNADNDYISIEMSRSENHIEVRCAFGLLVVRPQSGNAITVGVESTLDGINRRKDE